MSELERAVSDLGADDDELRLGLEAQLAGIALADRATLPLAHARLADLVPERAPPGPGQRMLLAVMAYYRAMGATRPHEDVAGTARRALEGGLLADVSCESQLFVLAATALTMGDRLAEGAAWFDRGLKDARRSGSLAGFALVSCFRSRVRRYAGALAEAEADARAGLEPPDPGTWPMAAVARGFLAEALLDRGQLDDARAALDEAVLASDALATFPLCRVRYARGKLRAASGELDGAVEDILACGRTYLAWGVVNPCFGAWRSSAALALARLDQRERAASLVDEELELARAFGAPRAIAVALRAHGLLAGGGEGIDRLGEAVELLASSEARLEQARALVELGALLRRRGRRSPARDRLREGLDLADRCGAAPLAARARAELVAAGARPHRARLRGPAALTGQERRIVEMAAAAMSNRDIAQALFVTLGTVEAHLTRAYAKLGVSSRREVAAALEREGA